MGAIVDDNAEDGWEAVQEDMDISMTESTLQGADTTVVNKQRAARKKRVKVSKHGIQYPSLPTGVVKKLATTYARTSGNGKAKISKETMDAIMQATDWFFEQVSDDLGAYAEHAGRKTIEESDIITLMGRYVFSPRLP
jgi:histone H3/H4